MNKTEFDKLLAQCADEFTGYRLLTALYRANKTETNIIRT